MKIQRSWYELILGEMLEIDKFFIIKKNILNNNFYFLNEFNM